MASTHLQTLTLVGDRVLVLATRDKKYRVIELGGPTAARAVPSGMWLLTAYEHPREGLAIVLASRQGKTHVIAGGKRGRTLEIDTAGTGPPPSRGHVGDLLTVGGEPRLVGARAQIYAWDGVAWRDDRADVLAAVGAAPPSWEGGPITAVIDVDGEPAIALERDRGCAVVLRRRGATWRALGAIEGDVNALAYRAADATIVAAGRHVWSVPADGGPPVEVATGVSPLWGAAVLGDTIYVSTLDRVLAVERGRLVEVRAAGTAGNHNHALHASRSSLYFVRDDALEIFDGRAWTVVPADELWP